MVDVVKADKGARSWRSLMVWGENGISLCLVILDMSEVDSLLVGCHLEVVMRLNEAA